MKKRILSTIIIASCLIFQGSTMTVSVLAAEDDPAVVKDESEDVADVADKQTEETEVEYINGMSVDYNDPDCLKYLQRQEAGVPDASVPQAFSSSITTSWGGVTYSHKVSVAEGKTILPGVDVSKWEGTINWNKVANAGINFAFIRIGYTGASTGGHNMDPYYKTNMDGAISAGLNVGIYYYSQAITVAEAESEAQYVLDNLGGYHLGLPIIMDYEYYDGGRLTESTPNKATKTEIVKAFCKKIEANGYSAGVYADKDMLTNSLNAGEFDGDYEVWLAQWRTSEPTYTGSYQYWQCGGATVDGISGTSDFDWGYFYDTGGSTGNSTSTGTDIVEMDGKWVYTVNGTPEYSYTGVTNNSYGWWYVKNGVVDFSYKGFAKNSYGWWYIEGGKVIFSTNSVIEDTKKIIDGKDSWWYVVGGQVQTSFTGLANYSNPYGWWYIKNGKVDFSVNTIAQNNYGWWYITGGKVQFGFTGVGNYCNDYGWWYIKDGKVDFSANTVAQNNYGWWYVTGGKVQFGFTGVGNYCNDYGWWYIKNGKVDFSANTVAQNNYGWWYVTGGKVQFGYTGVANYSNPYGWWYIKNGKVDFSFNGVASNKYGSWYIKNGKVDFSYNGTVTVSGEKYSVHNGEVAK